MRATVQLNDRVTLEIDEPKEMDTLHKAIVLSTPRKACDLCESTDTVMISNKDKEGNTYVNNMCRNCGASSKLGQYKVGGYFWREFEQREQRQSQDE